jgi:hypothetical protein
LAKASTIEDMRARVAAAREAEEADETSPVEPEMPASTEYVNRAHTLDQSDLAMPRIMMAQAMSKAVQSDEVEKGNWYLYPDNMQLGEKIDVVLLNMFKSLLYFEPGQGLLCRSFDLVQGVGTPGIECDKCPLQKWLPKEEGGGPPKCRLAYNYTAMVVGSDINDESSPLMGVLSLSSMSAPTGKLINTLKSTRNGIDGPWYPFRFRLGLKKTENKKGTFYVATASFVEKIDGELLEQAITMAQTLNPTAGERSIEMGDAA